jgi:hypothetical protein
VTRLAPGRLQKYVVRGGEQVFAPPYDMRGTGLHIFIVRAGREALSEVLEREINEPWKQAFLARGVLHRYEPTYDWVAFVFADVKRLAPDNLTLGDAVTENTAAAQRELVVMLPVTDKGPGPSFGDGRTPNSSLFYLPFVFNDFVPSIIAGRELYGYPKEYAEFTARGRLAAGWRTWRRPMFGEEPRWRQLTVSAHAPVRDPTNDTNGKKAYTMKLSPYLYVERGTLGSRTTDDPPDSPGRPPRDPTPPPGAIELLPDTGWAERASHPPQSTTAPPSRVPDERRTRAELLEVLDRNMQYMFLRQFRDPNQTTKASYQAIIIGDIVPDKAAAATWASTPVTEKYVLRFPELAGGDLKNPIACSLGIGDRVQADDVVRLEHLNITVNAANIQWDRS